MLSGDPRLVDPLCTAAVDWVKGKLGDRDGSV